jgi:hypothetical protein
VRLLELALQLVLLQSTLQHMCTVQALTHPVWTITPAGHVWGGGRGKQDKVRQTLLDRESVLKYSLGTLALHT